MGKNKSSRLNGTQHVFVAWFSSSCPHCVEFKDKHWSELKKKLDNDNRLRIYYITEGSSDTNISEVPSDLQNYRWFFPNFLLFNGNTWDESLVNPSSKLSGVAFNGPVKYIMGFPKRHSDLVPTSTNIHNWIKHVLDNDTIFKSRNDDSSEMLHM